MGSIQALISIRHRDAGMWSHPQRWKIGQFSGKNLNIWASYTATLTSDVVETVTSETETWLKLRDRDFAIKAETKTETQNLNPKPKPKT